MVLTAVAGMAGLPVFVAVGLCTFGLCISALPKYIRRLPEMTTWPNCKAWLTVVALSCLNSAAAAGASYGVGVVVGLLVMS